MKRSLLTVTGLLLAIVLCGQEAKKPTIMLLPSNHWCSARYFTKDFNYQGKTQVINDYDLAFRDDAELSGVVGKIGMVMLDHGYQLKDYVQEMKSMNDRMVEEEVTMSKSGGMIVETPLDMLRRSAKHDIEMCVDWTVSNDSKGKVVDFTIEAFDTYTSKRIASVSGVCKPSKATVAEILQDAIKKSINDLDAQLTIFSEKQKKDGRETILSIRIWDTSEYDLESEFEGDELLYHIEDWLHENTVKSSFNLSNATETRATFEQVMIPLFDEKGRATDARRFANELRKYLRDEFMIDSKVMMRGLGEAILVIGEK